LKPDPPTRGETKDEWLDRETGVGERGRGDADTGRRELSTKVPRRLAKGEVGISSE
jgi:hypothetical protein